MPLVLFEFQSNHTGASESMFQVKTCFINFTINYRQFTSYTLNSIYKVTFWKKRIWKKDFLVKDKLRFIYHGCLFATMPLRNGLALLSSRRKHNCALIAIIYNHYWKSCLQCTFTLSEWVSACDLNFVQDLQLTSQWFMNDYVM